MAEIQIGLVGLGHRGLHWLWLLQKLEGYYITAICDPVVALHEHALSVLDNRDEVTTYSNYADFLTHSDMDAVALCVRCKGQGALAAQALEAGKHVTSEVPAAHTMSDCWRIVTAVERTGLVYHLAEQLRYAGFVDDWRALVAEEKLGRVTYCEGQYIGYYGTQQFFQDLKTGAQYPIEELPDHPEAEPTWLHEMLPIHYLPHELSPMLKMLDDRVVEVTAMSTKAPSYSHPEIGQPDIQVVLMKTEKDAVLRMMCGFTQPVSHTHGHHWYQVMGTGGSVEWKRSGGGSPLMWLADGRMDDMAKMDWEYARRDAPAQTRGSGH